MVNYGIHGIFYSLLCLQLSAIKKTHQLLYFVMPIVHSRFSQMITMNNIRDILKEAQVLLSTFYDDRMMIIDDR